MSPASGGRRDKRSPEKRRRAVRPAPEFRGLDRDVGPVPTDESEARRRFAIPDPVAVIDGDEIEIDPDDEDHRQLAIVAEHPGYRDVLDDPLSGEPVDGVDPRLHITLHQIVTNQLWDDDPPEVWQAVRRLIDDGHDRHAILHALAYELAQELHPTLPGQLRLDPGMAAYRARLREL